MFNKYYCVPNCIQKGLIFMSIYSRRYKRDLTHNTGLRLDPQLREEAEKAAAYQGMTFSQFVRLSLRRNISLNQKIEEELAHQSFLAAAGKQK